MKSGAPMFDIVDAIMPPVRGQDGRTSLLTSPFVMTLSDIRQRFCFSPRREVLFDGLARYVEQTQELPNRPVLQLIGGSFVDDKLEPNDVDVANIVEAISPICMPLFFDRALTLKTFGVDPLTISLSGKNLRDCMALLRLGCYYSYRRSDGRQRSLVIIRADDSD